MATLSTTNMPSLPIEEHMQVTACDSLSGLLRCAVVSSCVKRLESFRLAAEQEAWEVIACRDVNEMIRCVFRESLPLSIVDMPPVGRGSDTEGTDSASELAARELYGDYRSLTEQLSELSDGSMLLVVCSDMESVREEIWARQLGVWSYLPLANMFPGQRIPDQQGLIAQDGAGAKPITESYTQGLPLVLSAAREALAKIAKADTSSQGPNVSEPNVTGQWNMKAEVSEFLYFNG